MRRGDIPAAATVFEAAIALARITVAAITQEAMADITSVGRALRTKAATTATQRPEIITAITNPGEWERRTRAVKVGQLAISAAEQRAPRGGDGLCDVLSARPASGLPGPRLHQINRVRIDQPSPERLGQMHRRR